MKPDNDRPRSFQETLGLREAVRRDRDNGIASQSETDLVATISARPKDEFGERPRKTLGYRLPVDLRSRLDKVVSKYPQFEKQRLIDVAIARLLDDLLC
jgi:hypothetical protein